MKNVLKRNTIILLTAFALFFACAAAIFGGAKTKSAAADSCNDHASYTALSSDGGEIGTAGAKSFYYLTENTILKENITIAANAEVTICLNGYILCGSAEQSVITVKEGATLNVRDCQADSAEHKHYYTVDSGTGLWSFTNGGAFLTSDNAEKYIAGGVITGGMYALGQATEQDSAAYIGGGIYNRGKLNISGGAVAGNYGYCGGVYNSPDGLKGKAFTMTGGKIVGNLGQVDSVRFTTYGGVYVGDTDTTVNISGECVIDGNYAQYLNDSFDSVTVSRNLYLNTNCYIFTGELKQGTRIAITVADYPSLPLITQGYINHNSDTDPNIYFVSDDIKYWFRFIYRDVQLTDAYDLTLNLYKDRSGNYVADRETVSYKYSAAATPLPTPTRGGYVFEGWYENAEYTGSPFTELAAGSHGGRTFYAKWSAVPQNDLFGGENIKFGKYNLWDCQRTPAFPAGNSPFYVFGLKSPLDVNGETVIFNDGDHVEFLPYTGDGAAVADKDGNGVITVSELSESDRNRIVNTLYGYTYATSRQAILDAVTVSEVKYDGDGNADVLANIGLIWALDDAGFLYTALDPDCGWSNTGGVGTISRSPRINRATACNTLPTRPTP